MPGTEKTEKIVRHAKDVNGKLLRIYRSGYTGVIEIHCSDGVPGRVKRVISEEVKGVE